MSEAARPTAEQLQRWYDADLARVRQLETTVALAECLGSMTVAVARAYRLTGYTGAVEIRQEHGVWQAFKNGLGLGWIVHPELLPDVMALASTSGWVVLPVPVPLWRRLLGAGPCWRVEVPFETAPDPVPAFSPIAPALRVAGLRFL